VLQPFCSDNLCASSVWRDTEVALLSAKNPCQLSSAKMHQWRAVFPDIGRYRAKYIYNESLYEEPTPSVYGAAYQDAFDARTILKYKMDPEVISDFLSEQRENTEEELQQAFLTIEDFWDRKLWHQLTDLLVEYFSNPLSAHQRLPLFKHFVIGFSEKINQLKYVRLGLLAATQCSGQLVTNFLRLS